MVRLFFNRQQRKLSEAQWLSLRHPEGKIILIDGEEQLGWNQRRQIRRILAPADGVLVSRHHPGELPILLHLEPDINLLHRCVQELAPKHYQTLEPHFTHWWHEYHGNIRTILLRCYDHV